MLDNSAWDTVSERLTADDFYRYEHRLTFNAMAQLAEAGHPLDVVTLSETLENRDQLEGVGGLAYLAELARNIDSAPAGGSALGVVGAVFVVLLILEAVGVTDIFKAI